MSTRLAFVLACALALVLLGATVRAEPLPTDPALVTGELENGLRYVVLRHAQPPGRAVVWLHMDTGSLNETERQRGIAHYLEHMAFNGSVHFPPGSLVPYFQSMGLTFGRDQNAFTNMEQTTFQLSLPDAKTENLGKAMAYFADVLTGLLLSPKEIDAERQIIQEERRTGLSGRQRARDQVMERLAPGSLYARRKTIGTEETIASVTEKDFRDYYGAWYTASNATVLVVADADPADVVKAVREAFGAAPKRPRPTPQPSGVVAYEKSFAVVASDPEIDSEEVRITRTEPVRPPVTSVEAWRDELLVDVGEAALDRRLEDKVSRGGTSYLSARASWGDEPRALHQWDLSARAAPGKWRPALEEVALELQRARLLGFTAREIEDAKRDRLAAAEREVETEATTPASSLVRRLNGQVTAGEPMLSARQRLDLLRRVLPTVGADEVSKRFAAEFDPKAVAFVAVLPAGAGVPTEAQLLDIGTRALAVQPTPEAEVAHATQLLKEAPKPGEVKEGSEHAATGVWSGWLSNNVRVHHRFMDTRKNEVTVEVNLVGGELLETAENRGVTAAAQVAWSRPATRGLSSGDVRELMVGKKVAVRPGGGTGGGRRGRGGGGGTGPGGPSISLTVSGSPDDLESGLQLAYLLLTQPRIEPAAFAEFQATQRQAIAESAKNPMFVGIRLAGSAPYPESDVRLQPLTEEQVGRLTLEASQAWLDRLVRESPVEVAVVGDLPRERALDLVARWLGALPARERVSPQTYLALRTLPKPQGPRRVERRVDTPTQQAFVLYGFYGADDADRPDARALNVAARILSTRMVAEVREKAQLVYSIGASSRAATTFPGYGVFSAGAPTEPHKVAALLEKLTSMYETFAAEGPTDEEMDVARRQTAVTLDEQWKDPSYWTSRLDLLTFRGTSLSEVARDATAYGAMTAKDVKAAFAKYWSKDRSIAVAVAPRAGTPAGEGAGGPKEPQPK